MCWRVGGKLGGKLKEWIQRCCSGISCAPQERTAAAIGILGNKIVSRNRPLVGEMTIPLRFVSDPLVLALIFISELLERGAREEDGVATITLVLTLAPAKLFVNDPPPLPPHPKLAPKSTASGSWAIWPTEDVFKASKGSTNKCAAGAAWIWLFGYGRGWSLERQVWYPGSQPTLIYSCSTPPTSCALGVLIEIRG